MTPEREGYMRDERQPYHDFESCMKGHGWERINYMNRHTKRQPDHRKSGFYTGASEQEQHRSSAPSRTSAPSMLQNSGRQDSGGSRSRRAGSAQESGGYSYFSF